MSHNKQLAVSNSIKNNLTILSSKLVENGDDQSMLYSDEEESLDQLSHQFQFDLIQELLINYQNIPKSMMIYSRLISYVNLHSKQNFQLLNNNFNIFNRTTFGKSLHHILNEYMIQKVKYYRIVNKSSQVLDIFYKFIYSQERMTIQDVLLHIKSQNSQQNIGEWFKTEALQNLFKNYIVDKSQYTKFMVNFMKFGLSYLFACSYKILKKKDKHIFKFQASENQIEVIKLSYISKLIL